MKPGDKVVCVSPSWYSLEWRKCRHLGTPLLPSVKVDLLGLPVYGETYTVREVTKSTISVVEILCNGFAPNNFITPTDFATIRARQLANEDLAPLGSSLQVVTKLVFPEWYAAAFSQEYLDHALPQPDSWVTVRGYNAGNVLLEEFKGPLLSNGLDHGFSLPQFKLRPRVNQTQPVELT